MDVTLENTLQEGKLWRQINALIVAHLPGENFNQATTIVAMATMTPLTPEGLAMERDEGLKGLFSTLPPDATGGLPSMPVMTNAIDFSVTQDVKGSFKNFQKHETKHVSEHQGITLVLMLGSKIALFGPSDGGKTTIANLSVSMTLLRKSNSEEALKVKMEVCSANMNQTSADSHELSDPEDAEVNVSWSSDDVEDGVFNVPAF